MNEIDYSQKYIKYKTKYCNLKQQVAVQEGGMFKKLFKGEKHQKYNGPEVIIPITVNFYHNEDTEKLYYTTEDKR